MDNSGHAVEDALLKVEHLRKWFPIRRGFFRSSIHYVRAVDDVSFRIRRGEVLGLVGESGCGKSTLGRVVLQLLTPTEGHVLFRGENITHIGKQEMRRLRKEMQMVFQDPFSSLNPRMTVGSALREVLHVHHIVPSKQIPDRINELLRMVGLNDFHARRYPHEFSSGQRQRIGIARALAVEPIFLVCDEPVSALDVSIQAQILNLLADLREALNLTYLFISHDLSVVRHVSNRIAVMYLGRLVEIGPVDQVINAPRHPYTRALLASVPIPDPGQVRIRPPLGSDVPSPADVPSGCAFHTRCPEAFAECRTVRPLLAAESEGHNVSCLKYPNSWDTAIARPELHIPLEGVNGTDA
ncbi:MAG: ABC transporter ATP-binding protein [Bacteroidetes bacterium]|nr:ABC transporter ATP-binding protein [Bacteroidota bacterium]